MSFFSRTNPNAANAANADVKSTAARPAASGERVAQSAFAQKLQGLGQRATETAAENKGGGDKVPDPKTSGLQGATPEQIDQLAQQYLKGVERFYEGMSAARNGPKVEIEIAQQEED